MNIADGYSIRYYGMMINDRARMSAYVEALRGAVRPGQVVLDIGTGTGIFAFLACQLGAARVYAIEQDDAIEIAKMCAENIPGSDRIIWRQGFSSDIELPEQVDVIIADLHGALPFYNQNVATLIDARRRHLKPDGQVIPRRDLMRAVPAQAPGEYSCVDSPWERNEYGIDFGAGRAFVANSWWRAGPEPIRPECLLSAPSTWGEIDYARTDSTNLDGKLGWRIERPGVMHGFYVWFDCETASGLGFSNAPDAAEIIYGRAFFPLLRPLDVITGDCVEARMSAIRVSGRYVFRWDTRVSDAAGRVKGAFRQSTFNSLPRNPQALQRLAVDYVPALNLEGQVDHAIMQAMSLAQPLGKIAGQIFARFPRRFADEHAALDHVSRLSATYARDDRT